MKPTSRSTEPTEIDLLVYGIVRHLAGPVRWAREALWREVVVATNGSNIQWLDRYYGRFCEFDETLARLSSAGLVEMTYIKKQGEPRYQILGLLDGLAHVSKGS